MKAPTHRLLLVCGTVALVTLLGLCWRPAIVSYHMRAMRRSQNDANVFVHHQQALVGLGYFQSQRVQLEHRTIWGSNNMAVFFDRVRSAPFQNDLGIVQAGSSKWEVFVIAYRGDMGLWKKLIAEFDVSEPDGATNRSQSVRPGPNQPSATTGSRR